MNNNFSHGIIINVDLLLKDIEKLELYFDDEKVYLDKIINSFDNMESFCKFNSFNKLCDIDLLRTNVDSILSKRREYVASVRNVINKYQDAVLSTKEIVDKVP